MKSVILILALVALTTAMTTVYAGESCLIGSNVNPTCPTHHNCSVKVCARFVAECMAECACAFTSDQCLVACDECMLEIPKVCCQDQSTINMRPTVQATTVIEVTSLENFLDYYLYMDEWNNNGYECYSFDNNNDSLYCVYPYFESTYLCEYHLGC